MRNTICIIEGTCRQPPPVGWFHRRRIRLIDNALNPQNHDVIGAAPAPPTGSYRSMLLPRQNHHPHVRCFLHHADPVGMAAVLMITVRAIVDRNTG